MLNKIVDKFTSGRFISTVIVVYVYGLLAVSGQIPAEFVQEMTKIVIAFYFLRKLIEGNRSE